MLKRRDLLRAGAAIPAVAAGESLIGVDAKKKNKHKKKHKGKGRDYSGMNVLMFITDQQRATMHFPSGWEEQNLPGMTRLKQNGLSFNRAFCGSCMCSPSRATLFTGYFPAQHGVKYTLEENMPANQYPQVELPLDLPNLATVMKAAGYSVPYKGKWHLSKMTENEWVPNDVNRYGFERWDPPDAGANQAIDQFGGGDPNNDGRFMNDDGDVDLGREGTLEYLTSAAAQQQPFFLTVSLVNPHDVLSYPNTYDYDGPNPPPDAGYTDADLVGTIGLPETIVEDLSTKPTAQRQALAIMNGGLGQLTTEQMQRNYLNFYGNLMKESDAYLVQILDTLETQGLLENTLVIQTSDHGEVGLCHNGMRQKIFNFYEETLRVPLTFSNPRLFSQAEQTNAMVSHVDFVPTMANLFNVPKSARASWQGKDYSGVLRKPKKNKGPQKYVVFTYDDFQAGQPTGPYVQPPNHLTTIREGRYKLARYYDEAGSVADQWEMYDLKKDSLETVNIADPSHKKNKKQRKEYKRLTKKLSQVEKSRLQPL
ncbi:MAG: sulfatase-like hydrolase/transferase [Chloroflexota bacterium]|nr:sulfatase-like hydrolase/transferase [Chloroflexota bacterium]